MASFLKPLQRGLLCSKQIAKVASWNSARLASTSKPPADTKVTSDLPTEVKGASYLADPWDILYGNERYEIAMKHKGFNDPYDNEALKRLENSTQENPNVIYSLENSRIIGCICNDDNHHILYMRIHKGETKRCECGHWFTCKDRVIPDLSEYGFAKDSGHGHH